MSFIYVLNVYYDKFGTQNDVRSLHSSFKEVPKRISPQFDIREKTDFVVFSAVTVIQRY